jgi:hypothetical protein
VEVVLSQRFAGSADLHSPAVCLLAQQPLQNGYNSRDREYADIEEAAGQEQEEQKQEEEKERGDGGSDFTTGCSGDSRSEGGVEAE